VLLNIISVFQLIHLFNKNNLLYVFFWVIHHLLNYSDAGELPRRKHTTFRTRRKFEIKKSHLVTTRKKKIEVLLLVTLASFTPENARVKLAKTGHGQQSFKLVVIWVLLLFLLFYVLFVCKCVLFYCHRVLNQLQLTNISYHTNFKTAVPNTQQNL